MFALQAASSLSTWKTEANSCFFVSLLLEAKWLAIEFNAILAQTQNTVVSAICCHAMFPNILCYWWYSPYSGTKTLLFLLFRSLPSICVTPERLAQQCELCELWLLLWHNLRASQTSNPKQNSEFRVTAKKNPVCLESETCQHYHSENQLARLASGLYKILIYRSYRQSDN